MCVLVSSYIIIIVRLQCSNFHAVAGWFQYSFTGVEQASGHTVQAGYIKGASHADVSLHFSVVHRLGSTSKSS